MTPDDRRERHDAHDSGRLAGAPSRTEEVRRPGALRVPTLREVRDVLRLAGPIVTVQVGLQLMGVVDAAMVGRVS
ncbi:MAG TPA: hypothetical protein VFV33_07035, partial [Gemmatimonadaceae bacterium]|nr:hypothetical protein [Gemmatimonadaceae bacterium]